MAKKKAMTDEQWEKCADPAKMLPLLGDSPSERKLRLFACACCRRHWHRLDGYDESCGEGTEELFRRPVVVAEAYANGEASEDELIQAGSLYSDFGAWHDEGPELAFLVCTRGVDALREITEQVVYHTSGYALQEGEDQGAHARRERKAHAALLRDVFGNPMRPVKVPPAWRTPTVTNLTEAAYGERILPAGHLDLARLTVLADALEDAGCADATILSHLRSPGPHVRGCWAVDLLLGKQ